MNQGVTSKRYQSKIFYDSTLLDYDDKVQVLRAAYRQIFERDINTFSIGDEFYSLEDAFLTSKITVKSLVEQLGCSNLYRKQFYQGYPNTKVIELATKHFLGRAPNNQSEIRYYNQILASRGLYFFIKTIVGTQEYDSIFGTNTVPHRRFPTLPAANFPNTETLYTTFTKQNLNIVVNSFPSTSSY